MESSSRCGCWPTAAMARRRRHPHRQPAAPAAARTDPGGAPRFLSATQAKALLATVRPRDVAGRTRRQLAAELLAEIVVLDRKLKDSDRRLTEAVAATGSGLPDLY